MNRIAINDWMVGEYIAKTAKCGFNPRLDNTIGVVDDSVSPESPDYVRGGALFAGYTQTSIWVHVAGCGKSWVTPTLLWAGFNYGFNQLGCRRLYGMVEATNTQARDICTRLGFEILTSLPDMFASGDAVVVSMTREQCRWLPIQPRTLKEGSDVWREGRRRGGTGLHAGSPGESGSSRTLGPSRA